MTQILNSEFMQTNRRDLLRGTAFAGVVALTAGFPANAGQLSRLPRAARSTAPSLVQVQSDAIAKSAAMDMSGFERLKQVLVAPPFAPVHEQIASGSPKIIEVDLVIQERLLTVDEDTGASIWALTYNGSVPGPLIVVHQDDYVEVTLTNPETSLMEHNIDFHAATGGLGGGALTHVFPGEEVVLRFKATKSGVFTYHCAPGGEMIPYHVCHGMNGTIMVLPREGLSDGKGNILAYDDVAYFGEQDFYLPKDELGEFKQYDVPGDDYSDSLDAMRKMVPTHSVFNGSIGALTGPNALTSEVGRTVLMIHNQANRDTRPHLIGGHGNYVWQTGKFGNAPELGLETWFVRGGSSAAAIYTFEQPGVYAYVNHSLIEAALLGATAHFIVKGDWNNSLMEQVVAPKMRTI